MATEFHCQLQKRDKDTVHRCNNCTQYSTGTNRLYRELRMARLPAECLLSDILTKWGGVMFRLDGCMAQSGNWSCMQRKRELRTTCLVYLVDHSHTLRNCSHFKTKFSFLKFFYPHLWPKLVHIMIKTLLTILSLYICNNIVHSCYFCLGEKAESKVENTALSQRLTTPCTYISSALLQMLIFLLDTNNMNKQTFPFLLLNVSNCKQ